MTSKGQNLPDEDEVMRYIPWQRLRKDEHDNVLGVLPQAFELRPEENGLSVNWLEHFNGSRSDRIVSSVHKFRLTISVGKKSRFAIAPVKEIRSSGEKQGKDLKVVYWPEPENTSHSEIRRVPREDQNLMQALADSAFSELISNSDIT